PTPAAGLIEGRIRSCGRSFPSFDQPGRCRERVASALAVGGVRTWTGGWPEGAAHKLTLAAHVRVDRRPSPLVSVLRSTRTVPRTRRLGSGSRRCSRL